MGIDSLNKDTSGAALVLNFKDVFPGKLSKMYIYKGVNLVSKGNEVFSREDTTTYTALELLTEVDVIYGGQAMTSTVRTITESKSVKETARQKISSDSVTLFFRDLEGKVDLTDHNLYYTIGNEFIQSDLKDDQLEVLSDAQIVPNLLEKLISGTSPISTAQKGMILNNKTASFTFSPAVLDDNLPSSKVRFVDGSIFKVLPVDEKDFEITSVDIESDQSLGLEYRNGVKGRGVIENGVGNLVEYDLDFKMDKPLLPLQVNPFAKFSNIQFAIENFNYFQRMPYLSAKHFLGSDRTIVSFIKGTTTDGWANDLAHAVVDMFKMSWAISTGYADYDTDKDSIGGVALKSMVGKDPDKLYPYVDQILRNWEYKKNIINKNTDVYKRALQVLAASSEVIESSYCVGKGLTEFHKTIFDFYLDLDSTMNKDVTDISMTLKSDRYKITFPDLPNGDPDLDKPIINLKSELEISRTYVTNYGRTASLSELDDPINISGLTTFAGEINTSSADATKYMIGVDVTDPSKIAEFLGNEGSDTIAPHPVSFEHDSEWYVNNFNGSQTLSGAFQLNDYEFTLVPSQTFDNDNVEWSNKHVSVGLINPSTVVPAPVLSVTERNDFIKKSVDIPANAHKVVFNFDNVVEQKLTSDISYKSVGKGAAIAFGSKTQKIKVELIRYTGAIVSYEISTTTHGVTNRKQNYDKGEFLNMILKYSDAPMFKRNLSLTDNWRDADGNQVVKIKSLDHIFLSFFLGNYIDIKINYKYLDDNGKEVTGNTLLPRFVLPSSDDERRTKLGIRL